MIKNMINKTGKPIKEWLHIVNKKNFLKHIEKVKFLKEKYSLTHGYANLIARNSK